jgi:hypothetical protein
MVVRLFVALVLACSVGGSMGCGARGGIAEEAPPPAREEIVIYKPGYVWIQGNYTRSNGGWAWVPGRYVRERPGYVWISGRWDRWPSGYVWVTGGWRKQGRVVSHRN